MKKCDLLIVGGGPAGISAAISASSEGLDTIIVESKPRLGGQVVDSSLIENVPGFPNGISGKELIRRIVLQAQKFGTEIINPVVAERIIPENGNFRVVVRNRGEIFSRAILLAGGLSYNPLQAVNVDHFIGKGVSYGPATVRGLKGRQLIIYIVGGANSAGQAAMNLSKRGDSCRIVLLVRGDGIENSMSDYLCKRVRAAPNIEVWPRTTVKEVRGKRRLNYVVMEREGEVDVEVAHGLQIFIGASPKTQWLDGTVALHPQGYILTGYELVKQTGLWNMADRPPIPYETSLPGVFCIGDVRQLSVKRAGAAVGEGSAVVARIHEYFRTLIK